MRLVFVFLFYLFACWPVCGQLNPAVIVFWNVENLYDTIDDPLKSDEEFLPGGKLAWTGERYRQKLHNLAEVLSKIGRDVNADGAALIGLCEIENRKVLDELVAMPSISRRKYQPILLEGPDLRGIDPALLYNPVYFTPAATRSLRVRLPDSTHHTRNILVVTGDLLGEPIAVVVNHWPSRRGGEKASRPARVAAARVVRALCDSMLKAEPGRGIVLLGDFNDDPVSFSVREILCSDWNREDLRPGCFFNPMNDLFRKGVGTLAWNDRWNLFDQIILSQHWIRDEGLIYSEARVFNEDFLRNQSGNFRGYPFRTYSGGVYTGGYSDHFPAFISVKKAR